MAQRGDHSIYQDLLSKRPLYITKKAKLIIDEIRKIAKVRTEWSKYFFICTVLCFQTNMMMKFAIFCF